MNPEYVILGGWFWRLWGKKVVLWYAHYLKTLKLVVASKLAHKIVTSVPEAFPFASQKLEAVGQGIDTDKFRRAERREGSKFFNILFLGRISPVKDLETLLAAVKFLVARSLPVRLTVVGEAPNRDRDYAEKIQHLISESGLASFVSWMGRVPHQATPPFFNQADLFVNLTCRGSFDKTTLEAMSSECPVIVANAAFKSIFSEAQLSRLMFEEKNALMLAEKIQAIMSLTPAEREVLGRDLRTVVVERHSLRSLSSRLLLAMKN
jgi:glycosyltransferase involved in cell wall biosynthesis